MSTTTRKPWTADELSRLPEGWRYEIDEGELVIMAPAGFRHNRTVSRIGLLLADAARAQRLGEVLTNETGVYLRHESLQTLRGVDVAFYSNERLARVGDEPGFTHVPPDLAVEVHLPGEADMQRKVAQYLAAGVRAVWVVDIRRRTLTQYRPGEGPRTFDRLDAAIQEPVLPGFECRLRDLFADAAV